MRLTPLELVLANLEGKLPTTHGWMSPEQALEKLRELTGVDFGFDARAWRKWVREQGGEQAVMKR